MPVFTLAFVYGAPVFKMLRSQMEIALDAEYTTYGEALGLAPRTIFVRAARVAAGSTVVIVGTVIMFLLGGDVLVESVFNMSGLGQYAVQAIVTADYAPIQGFCLLRRDLHHAGLPCGRPDPFRDGSADQGRRIVDLRGACHVAAH